MSPHTVRKSWDVCKPESRTVGPMPGRAFEGSGHAVLPGPAPLVARWPLSLSLFVLFISGSPGGPGARSAYRSPHPRLHRHFNALPVTGCSSFEGGGGPAAPRAPADSDPQRGLTRAPLGTDAGAPGASFCAPARFRPARGSACQDGPGLGGGRAAAARGRQPQRGGSRTRARLQRGCAERVRRESEPVGGAARAPAAAAGSRPGARRPAAWTAALQSGTALARRPFGAAAAGPLPFVQERYLCGKGAGERISERVSNWEAVTDGWHLSFTRLVSLAGG